MAATRARIQIGEDFALAGRGALDFGDNRGPVVFESADKIARRRRLRGARFDLVESDDAAAPIEFSALIGEYAIQDRGHLIFLAAGGAQPFQGFQRQPLTQMVRAASTPSAIDDTRPPT